MNIFLSSRLSGHGGVAVYNRTLAHALLANGHEVTVVTSDTSGERAVRTENLSGLSTVTLPTSIPRLWRRLPLLRHYARSWNHRQYSLQLDKWLGGLPDDARPDVIEFAEVGGEGYFYTRRVRRQPVVVRCHTPTFVLRRHHHGMEMNFDTSIVERMEKACIRRADVLTTPSRDMAEVVSAETGEPLGRFHPVPNAVDLASFETEKSEIEDDSLPQDAVVVLHVGRLERIKGIGVLGDAIPEVVKACPLAQFVFIGQPRAAEDGRMWDVRLREQFDRSGVSSHVRILNYVEQPVMNGWYSRADLSVVPSLNYESFSYTCAQAMAAGIPVIASAIGGIPETLDHGTCGRLVETGNVAALRDALINLITNESLRVEMGQRGLERARRCFAAPVVARRMEELYRVAVSSRK